MGTILLYVGLFFLFIFFPVGTIFGAILYWLFGFWVAVIGFIIGTLIQLFGLKDLWAIQKVIMLYILMVLMNLIWPAIFVGIFFWMKHK